MNKMISGSIALCALVAMSSPVAAQEAGEWLVRAGFYSVGPKSDNGDVANVSSGQSVGFNVTYMVSDTFGVELLAALPFSHDINLANGGKVGETKHLPPTLMAQYHYNMGGPSSVYFGLGLNYTLFFEEETSGALAGSDLELSNSQFGAAAQVGYDYRFGNNALVNFDIRWIDIDTDATLNGAPLETVEIDPLVIGLTLGMRF